MHGIVRGGERLGIYYLESGAVQRPSKVIYDRANSSIACAKPGDIDWDKALENATWFHVTGITPAISEGAAALTLEAVKKAREKEMCIRDRGWEEPWRKPSCAAAAAR